MPNWGNIASTWGPVIAQGVGIAGQAAASRSAAKANARVAEAAANQGQDNFAQRNYANQQNAMLTAGSMAEAARLDRARLGLDAPEQRTRQALWGDILQNVQDAKINGLPSHIPKVSVSGGLRPSLIGAGGKQAGQALQTQALQALLSGSDVPEMPDFSKLVMTPPEATPLPQAGAEDKWLNILATIGQISQGYDTVRRTNQSGTASGVARPGGTSQGPTGASDPWGAY